MKKFLLAASLLALTACKHDSTPVVAPVFVPVVTTVTVTPSANQIEIGRQAAFTAIVKDQRDSVMTGKTIAWASSNPAVASVTGTGAVVGITRGSTVITATTVHIARSLRAKKILRARSFTRSSGPRAWIMQASVWS